MVIRNRDVGDEQPEDVVVQAVAEPQWRATFAPAGKPSWPVLSDELTTLTKLPDSPALERIAAALEFMVADRAAQIREQFEGLQDDPALSYWPVKGPLETDEQHRERQIAFERERNVHYAERYKRLWAFALEPDTHNKGVGGDAG